MIITKEEDFEHHVIYVWENEVPKLTRSIRDGDTSPEAYTKSIQDLKDKITRMAN